MIKYLLKSIDIFGEKVELNLNLKNTSQTIVGGIFTLITIGFVLVGAWLIGRDIIYHEAPLVILEDQLFSHRPKLNLDSQNLPIAITLQDYDQKSWIIPNYFKFEIFESVVYNNNMTSYAFFYNYTLCKKENFPNYSNEYFDKSGLANYLCVENQNFTIQGYWDDILIRQLYVRIRLCNNETDGGGCAPFYEIKNFIDKQPIAWSIYFQNSIINIQKPDPISSYTMAMYKNVRLSVYRHYSIFIKPQTVKTDTGFIFEDYKKSSCLSYDSDYIDESDFKPNLPLVDIIINVAEHQIIYNRSYIKLQSIIANLGGLLKTAMVVSYILSFYFSKIKIYQKIANRILDFSEKHNNKLGSIVKCDSQIKFIEVSPNKPLFSPGIKDNLDFRMNNIHKSNEVVIVKLEANEKYKTNLKNNLNNPHSNNSPQEDNNNNFQNFLKSHNKIKFSTYDVVKYLCCYFRINSKSFKEQKYRFYRNTKKYVFEKLDVRNIIQSIEEFEMLKKIILDEIQLYLFQLVTKKRVNEFELENSSIKLSLKTPSESEYYLLLKQRILDIENNSNDISLIDRRIYNQMTAETKQIILGFK
jgi:hypothetical protein